MTDGASETAYAATRNDQTRYPTFEGSARADVCIIGGGFSGVATALSLAERGYAVILLESRCIGSGASGRNGGQVIAGLSGERRIVSQLGADGRKLVRDIRYLGHDIIAERIAKYAIACDWRAGWMEVAARPHHMRGLREDVAGRIAEGDNLEIVEPDRLRDVIDTNAYHGGAIDRRSGHLHPLNLLLGEARAAAGLGAKIYENSPVIAFEGGAKPVVRTASGRVACGSIVLAGYSDHAFQRGRLAGLVFPTGSYIVATEPLDEALTRRLNPQNLAVADSNVVLDYFRFSADRRLLFGGRANYWNRDPKDVAAAMRPRLLAIFPELKDAAIEYAWGGKIDIVLTRAPAIGRLAPSVYYTQGYCGHGVNVTHIAAEIISDAVSGTTDRLDLFDKIKQIRLPVGRFLGSQMLALGMLYYRLRDWL